MTLVSIGCVQKSSHNSLVDTIDVCARCQFANVFENAEDREGHKRSWYPCETDDFLKVGRVVVMGWLGSVVMMMYEIVL
jgi:hypothetical protein